MTDRNGGRSTRLEDGREDGREDGTEDCTGRGRTGARTVASLTVGRDLVGIGGEVTVEVSGARKNVARLAGSGSRT